MRVRDRSHLVVYADFFNPLQFEPICQIYQTDYRSFAYPSGL
jgi:hypothetical protein